MLVSCHTFLSNIYNEIETAIDITVNINIKIKIDICLRITSRKISNHTEASQ